MPDANDRQVGGSHYKITYQPWDFFCDIDLHFLPANALKYISRWREKDGIKDLNKAVHYLEKAIERDLMFTLLTGNTVDKWVDQYDSADAMIMTLILRGEYSAAIECLHIVIEKNTVHVDFTMEAIHCHDNSNT